MSSCSSPVFTVSDGSNSRTCAPEIDDGLCSVPRGTVNTEPSEVHDAFATVVVPQRDVDVAADHMKELVGVDMAMPDELAANLDDADVEVVDARDYVRAPFGIERSKGAV